MEAKIQTATDGVVLKSRDIGAATRVLSVLTGKSGLIDVFANGARRPKSRLAAVAQPFAYSDFVISRRKDVCTVEAGEIKHTFYALREDIRRLSLAFYLSELTGFLAPRPGESGANPGEYLRLFLNSLYLLETGTREEAFVRAVYELRILAMSGYMPDLVACVSCGVFDGARPVFYPGNGIFLCEDCAAAENADRPAVHISGAVLSAMRHVIYSDFEKIFSFRLSGEALGLFGRACEAYVTERTERAFKSLDFYKSVEKSIEV
jgi:DNA repair protein RecO (recombination protein O)